MKTKNGYVVRDLRPFDWGAYGKDYQHGKLDCSILPYAIWNLEGRAEYVHGCDKNDLSGFDLDLSKERRLVMKEENKKKVTGDCALYPKGKGLKEKRGKGKKMQVIKEEKAAPMCKHDP